MSGGIGHRAIVIGGGPAGAAAAAYLARANQGVLLIERSTGPQHKICGEFVSWEAQAYLSELGVDVIALGGLPIRTVRVAAGRQSAEAPLPFTGVGLSRLRLDEALLARAEAHGASVVRGQVVREVAAHGGELSVRLRGGEVLEAQTAFLATGKHDLHAPRRPQAANGLVGFKMYFRLSASQTAALGDAVEVAIFDGGYAGLQTVEDGMVNLCLLARAELFERAGKRWDGLLDLLCETSPHLGTRLNGAAALLERPLTISQVPYGFVHQGGPGDPPGLYRLGDQMGVIPSFCGDGMAIALHSAKLAAANYLAHEQPSAFHRQVSRDVGGQIRLAGRLYNWSQNALARRGMMAAFRLFPGLISAVAEWTRIPAARIKAG